jgi:hypothetical protein
VNIAILVKEGQNSTQYYLDSQVELRYCQEQLPEGMAKYAIWHLREELSVVSFDPER